MGHMYRNTYTHTTEYYSALEKKKDISSRAITRLNLEDTILSQISRLKKNKYYMVLMHMKYLKESKLEKLKGERWL